MHLAESFIFVGFRLPTLVLEKTPTSGQNQTPTVGLIM